MEDIRKLIRDYTIAVREAFDELLAVYPSFEMRPLGLKIPRSGILPSGRTYTFHGIGCRFVKGRVVTDMDFGPNGRIDGFDAWRLSQFAKSLGDKDATVDRIQLLLNQLVESGEIVKNDSGAGAHLYFPAS